MISLFNKLKNIAGFETETETESEEIKRPQQEQLLENIGEIPEEIVSDIAEMNNYILEERNKELLSIQTKAYEINKILEELNCIINDHDTFNKLNKNIEF